MRRGPYFYAITAAKSKQTERRVLDAKLLPAVLRSLSQRA